MSTAVFWTHDTPHDLGSAAGATFSTCTRSIYRCVTASCTTVDSAHLRVTTIKVSEVLCRSCCPPLRHTRYATSAELFPCLKRAVAQSQATGNREHGVGGAGNLVCRGKVRPEHAILAIGNPVGCSHERRTGRATTVRSWIVSPTEVLSCLYGAPYCP